MPGVPWYDTLQEVRDTLMAVEQVAHYGSEPGSGALFREAVFTGRKAPVNEALEDAARREFEKDVPNRRELVAIAFDTAAGGVEWRTLRNIAEVDPWCNFAVSSEQLMGVIAEARGLMSPSQALNFRKHIAVWHSHYEYAGPSAFDVDTFPTWLTEWAMVYHAPTATTIPYEA